MATEPDQTRWVGIRPTPDCNDIPTTSKKLAPAISDLAAIIEHCAQNWYANNQDCTVECYTSQAAVPASEIWIVTNIVMQNLTSFCDMEMTINDSGVVRPLCSWYSVPAIQKVSWNGIAVLMSGNILRGFYRLGGATDDFRLWAQGWIIKEY